MNCWPIKFYEEEYRREQLYSLIRFHSSTKMFMGLLRSRRNYFDWLWAYENVPKYKYLRDASRDIEDVKHYIRKINRKIMNLFIANLIIIDFNFILRFFSIIAKISKIYNEGELV